jgi:hypothetical protein
MGQHCEHVLQYHDEDVDGAHSHTLRIRIKKLPALRYEGIDLSPYQVGQTYEVERRLAELLIERGYAEQDTLSDRDAAVDSDN